MKCTATWPTAATPGNGFGERPLRRRPEPEAEPAMAAARMLALREAASRQVRCVVCRQDVPAEVATLAPRGGANVYVCAECAFAALPPLAYEGTHRGWLK